MEPPRSFEQASDQLRPGSKILILFSASAFHCQIALSLCEEILAFSHAFATPAVCRIILSGFLTAWFVRFMCSFRGVENGPGLGPGKLFSLRLSAADQAGCWAYRRQHQAAIGCRCHCVAAAKCQFHVAQASPNVSQSPIDDTKSVAVTLAPAPPPCGRVLRCLALIVYHTDQLPVSTYMHSAD